MISERKSGLLSLASDGHPLRAEGRELKALAREHTAFGVKALVQIITDSLDDRARISAIKLLLEHGWGMPGEAPNSTAEDVTVVVRHIVDGKDVG